MNDDDDEVEPMWFDELGECTCDHPPGHHGTLGCWDCDCNAYWST